MERGYTLLGYAYVGRRGDGVLHFDPRKLFAGDLSLSHLAAPGQ